MAWKPEYAAARKAKAQSDPEYRAKRNAQSVSNPLARKEYMANYYEANPDKFKGRTPEQRESYNAKRRTKYAEDAQFRESHKATVREWAAQNPEKKHAQRVRKYGLTPEQMKAMLDAQGQACAVCGHTEKRHKLFPMIDHCHTTGKVRGILCSRCNMAIGLFRDSPELMRKAIEYLSRG